VFPEPHFQCLTSYYRRPPLLAKCIDRRPHLLCPILMAAVFTVNSERNVKAHPSTRVILKYTVQYKSLPSDLSVSSFEFQKYRIVRPHWCSGQSSWLQIQRSRVRFPALPDFLVVGLERGPLSLVSTIEELLGRSSSSGIQIWHYAFRGSAALTTRRPSIRKMLALTSPTNSGRLVGIVRTRTQATGVCFVCWRLIICAD
jgi:hypothetical protein